MMLTRMFQHGCWETAACIAIINLQLKELRAPTQTHGFAACIVTLAVQLNNIASRNFPSMFLSSCSMMIL